MREAVLPPSHARDILPPPIADAALYAWAGPCGSTTIGPARPRAEAPKAQRGAVLAFLMPAASHRNDLARDLLSVGPR
jgi:hypothetical protein